MTGWMAILGALLYVAALFAIAYYGDTHGSRLVGRKARAAIYALSLAVYCTSWTFFGSVGLATSQGLDFLPIYIGPALVLLLGHSLIVRIVRLAKSQNITSVADFVAARYGKSESVAALVAIIAVIGAVPYIALQLKAVSASLLTVLGSHEAGQVTSTTGGGNALGLATTVILAGFAMAFGTRRIDATEHQDGLMLAVAAESVVKLIAFFVVGAFVTWGMFDGVGDLTDRALADPRTRQVIESAPDWGSWASMTTLAAFAIILLPRQFHVTVVENRDERDVRTASWVFPLYLVAINLFVLPIAVAGLLIFPDGAIDRDMTVLALPIHAGSQVVTLITLLGGLSAATAMVIVASVALSIMVSNDLVMPLILRGRLAGASGQPGDVSQFILGVRRVVIVAMLFLAYAYSRVAGEAALAAIGLLSFAAIAQIAPSFFGGLVWSRGTARGANAGMVCGILIWTYTILLPSLNRDMDVVTSLIENGPLGVAALKPTALFGLDLPLITHGVVASLAINILVYVVISLTRAANPIERLQASVFVGAQGAPMGQAFRIWRATTTEGELVATVERYLGTERTRRSFEAFLHTRGATLAPDREADIHVVRFAEYLLASAIGAASSRLVLTLLLRRGTVSTKAALKLLDDASAAIQYNRDLLQHALDHARQGITVFDKDLRLLCWNREFRDLFEFPVDFLRIGCGLEEIVRFNAERGFYGGGATDDYVATRIESIVNDRQPFRLRLKPTGVVIEIRSARMPDGGLVTTYTDVTDQVETEEALEATNETLEQRVRERTEQLTRLNGELARAKSEADEANLSKTRFLAAASHDILQPLNAARLYATSLLERAEKGAANDDSALARNVDASLEAVEEILTSLLDISRLDAGALKPEISRFDIADILRRLQLEFEPIAREKGLRIEFRLASFGVRSDRRLLRRMLQNLISNAIKYTPQGRVLVSCRARGSGVRVGVWDTGLGIPKSKQKAVFEEFRRLDEGARTARGLGLGLSIVERIGKVLKHPVGLRSIEGRGSVFFVDLPRVFDAAPIPLQQAAPAPPAGALAGMVVVAIDNEPRILEGMTLMLEGWGCQVVAVRDAEEALARLGERPGVRVAGVIADFHLDEDRSGIEAIARLREVCGPIPAVLATADRTQDVRDAAHAADIAVLNKPLKPAALRAMLAQWRTLGEAAE
ncbi:MAG: hybrid sensor histidine kinase/response regulator [Methylobacteriaceae bacterium]|nr:hybrid sensor histidine kinase/response regulator [Methylobacteriaceae bacterium]